MTPDELRRLTEAAIESDLLHASGDVYIDADYYRAVLDLIPPYTSEIIAAIDRGDRVEDWAAGLSEWRAELYGVRWWQGLLTLDGDLPQPGYRIVPDSRIEDDQ